MAYTLAALQAYTKSLQTPKRRGERRRGEGRTLAGGTETTGKAVATEGPRRVDVEDDAEAERLLCDSTAVAFAGRAKAENAKVGGAAFASLSTRLKAGGLLTLPTACERLIIDDSPDVDETGSSSTLGCRECSVCVAPEYRGALAAGVGKGRDNVGSSHG